MSPIKTAAPAIIGAAVFCFFRPELVGQRTIDTENHYQYNGH